MAGCFTKPLGLQVPPQKVFGPSKPTPNTFSEGTWRPRDVFSIVRIAYLFCEQDSSSVQTQPRLRAAPCMRRSLVAEVTISAERLC